MTLQSAGNAVWFAGLILQVLLAVLLLAKRTWERFPTFTAYSLFSLCEAVVLYAVRWNGIAYFYSYVVGESIGVVLGLAVVYEVFNHLFSVHPGLRKLAWLTFRVAVVLLALLAGAVIYAKTPIGKNSVGIALLVVEEAARILEVGLITFLFLFSSVFGLHWRQCIFGITVGLGIFTVVELIGLAMAPLAGPIAVRYLNLSHMLAFDTSMLVWIGYLLAPERVTLGFEMPKRAQLEQWNQAIMELIHQ